MPRKTFSRAGAGALGHLTSISYADSFYDGDNSRNTFTYDATCRQATASYGGYSLANSYDGDRLRVKKVENGFVTYYLRSSVLGGRVVAEANSSTRPPSTSTQTSSPRS